MVVWPSRIWHYYSFVEQTLWHGDYNFPNDAPLGLRPRVPLGSSLAGR